MSASDTNSLKTDKMRQTIVVQGKTYHYASLGALAAELGVKLDKQPVSRLVLAENVLRRAMFQPGEASAAMQVLGPLLGLESTDLKKSEVPFYPSRVLMQDFTGVPAMVDMAAMRDAVAAVGKNPAVINPSIPVDLVIDHSVMVDYYGTSDAWSLNTELEYQRNHERYTFLRYCQENFKNFRVIPPESGICHQVNLEYLAKVVFGVQVGSSGEWWAFPDTVVGTDSHTTMINGLSVLGWGVGGIEAEAALLDEPITMLIPDVFGVRVHGQLKEGVTATDLVLTVVQKLRAKGVVDKFVEFYGDGLGQLGLADRATIANMAPEYGATCGFFPIDRETLNYLELTGRSVHEVALVEAYAKAQGLWRKAGAEPTYTDTMDLDLDLIEPSLAGPKRPQDRVSLDKVNVSFSKEMKIEPPARDLLAQRGREKLTHGDVVIAAITSCTNTSNPSVMVSAGLVARKARQRSLRVKPWVKTSLSPGSMVVTDYLASAGLDVDLDALGFQLTGYGCSTCIGNSGPLDPGVAKVVEQERLVVASVLSGNRNFEGRVHPQVQANYLGSPPLVVAYALAGNVCIDLTKEPLGEDEFGKQVFLKDIWPTQAEINEVLAAALGPDMFRKRYSIIDRGDETWQSLPAVNSPLYAWDDKSTYIRRPPYFVNHKTTALADISGARVLALLGDSVTTDHISPAGNIKKSSPAGRYLLTHGVAEKDFNSYGSRRGNHEVMMRGTFANIRIRNALVEGVEGGFTRIVGATSNEPVSIYDAAMYYKESHTPLIIMAGKEYGSGSSRDWAAKGTALLGVRAVVTESFERIHRSNLVGMGVVPLEFDDPLVSSWRALGLTGDEEFALIGLSGCQPGGRVILQITGEGDQVVRRVNLRLRIDTQKELTMIHNGGMLHNALTSFWRLWRQKLS